MAIYDKFTPEDILKGIKSKRKQGFFVQRLADKKILAQHHEVVLGDKKTAEEIYAEMREDMKRDLPRAPAGTGKEMARFLKGLQDKDSGSFVKRPTVFWLEIERAKHTLKVLKDNGLKPRYPLRFLERVDTGKKFKEYFLSLLHDLSKDNSVELNLAITAIPRIKEMGFHEFSQDWDSAFFECLEYWQDPKTGYWGPWRQKGKTIEKLPSLSTTFHIMWIYFDKTTLSLKDPKYRLKHARKIWKTTWDIKNKDYPFGWLEKRCWSTHHNYDVAEIFLCLFNEMRYDERTEVRRLFQRFLKWTLSNLCKDGGFIGYRPDQIEPTMQSTNFAILLLRAIGFFSGPGREYRDVIWKDVRLPINSYRIYDGKVPNEEYDTSSLKSIVYKKKTTMDPLHARSMVFRFWSENKASDPQQALNIDSTMQFERFPISKFKISEKMPKLRSTDMVVAVDKFGREIWSRGDTSHNR